MDKKLPRMNYVCEDKEYRTLIRSLDDPDAQMFLLGQNQHGGFDFVLYWKGTAIGLTTREPFEDKHYYPEVQSDGTNLYTIADVGLEIPNTMGGRPMHTSISLNQWKNRRKS